MKPITQERIFKALEKARHQTWVVNQRAKEIKELVKLWSMHGLKLRFGASVQNESTKVKLECTYAGFDPYDAGSESLFSELLLEPRD